MAATDPSPADASPALPDVAIADPPIKVDLRRTWPQRLTIAGAFLAAIGCFAAGSLLYAAQRIVEDRNVVQISSGAPEAADASTFESNASSSGGDEPIAADTGADEPLQPVETFPPAEPAAKNFLITGADNNSCVDPDSPYAGAFGDRENFGERSDTIMLWRVNPATSQVAVLSFPRDLWVTIAGSSGKKRINAAYERGEPQRLIDTIYDNFGIRTDHFIQVDFCAFKSLVDAVDGVAVPFEFPVIDPNTGLNVPEAGCFTFDGDHALAYVRSRKLRYLAEDGEWKQDGTSDLGRISRQQDFIRRTVDSLLAAGAFDPAVIRALIQTSDDYLIYDNGLSVNKMLEFAGVLRNVDPASITSYQIEASGQNIQGASVLIPRLDGDNMRAVLAVFQGVATLVEAPEQVFEEPAKTTTSAPSSAADDDAEVTSTTLDSPIELADEAPTATAEAVPFETLPVVEAEVNSKGIFPDPNVSCN
jgi:LCP family protein required for cell wall assembly